MKKNMKTNKKTLTKSLKQQELKIISGGNFSEDLGELFGPVFIRVSHMCWDVWGRDNIHCRAKPGNPS